MTLAARPAVSSGLEIFVSEKEGRFTGNRLGLIANAASIDSTLRSAVGLLRSRPELELAALFAPEHGLDSGLQDMVSVAGGRETGSGLPVHSLYGDSLASLTPSAEMLDGIDLLVADLQDVGARYYTFAATIALALEAIASRGGRLVVLDRPNPIGGTRIEGPGLLPAARSFVGHFDVPIRHGLTVGELLVRHAREKGLSGAIDVVPMRGWKRSMSFEDTGLPWVPPSPNMPTVDTAYVYPGTCLIEGTNLSEGRGTTRPFEWIGAPYLNSGDLAGALDSERLPGVAFRPHTFLPAFHKWAGQPCGGVALHVTDRDRFLPVRTGVAILVAARRLAPSMFAWRREPYEFVTDPPAIDLLTGSAAVREAVDGGASLDDIVKEWAEPEAAWSSAMKDSLLYPAS